MAVDSGKLDVNSTYAYLILCEHFSDTCLLAEQNEELVGFVSAYFPPQLEDTLFIWQIAVKKDFRGQGIAKSLLINLLESLINYEIYFLETSITPSNKISRSLIFKLAEELQCPVEETELFSRELFVDSPHEPEFLIRIGPFNFLEIKEKHKKRILC